MDELQGMDELERQLRAGRRTAATSTTIDPEQLRRPARRRGRRRRCEQLQAAVEDAGGGRLHRAARATSCELTPRGIRKIGQKALQRHLRPAQEGPLRQARDRPIAAPAATAPTTPSLRVRRSVPARPAGDADERDRAARAPARRCSSSRTTSRSTAPSCMTQSVDRADARHEPLDAPARLLPGRQEGRAGAQQPDPRPVPARQPLHRRLLVPTRASSSRSELPQLDWNEYEYGTNMQHGLHAGARSCWPGTRAATSRSS